jgi:hypothetical protein
MAKMKLDIKLPKQSLTYLGIGLAGILLFIVAGIVPASRSLVALDARTADVKYQIEEQRTLAPLYKALQGKSEKKESELLPLPEKGKLAQSKISTIPMSFGTAAKMSGMSLISATPELNAMTGDAQFLAVNTVLRGDFINFRKFLINIGGIPYVQHIEEISIQEIPDTREFRLKIWVAVG